MPERINLTWEQVNKDCKELANLIGSCDAIVAIGRGGLVPGTIISYIYDIPVVNFTIKSYNEFTAGELVFGQIPGFKFNSEFREKRVVIIDDLSDKGKTLLAAKDYFESCEFTNFKFATLYIKKSTQFIPNFYIKEFDDNIWLDFPWESVRLD
jgi:hypoxanthine phosphoribosyltransferase